jgi:hypothetical protein
MLICRMHAVFRIVTGGRVILPTGRFAVTVTSSEAMKTSTVQDAQAIGGGNGAASGCTQVIFRRCWFRCFANRHCQKCHDLHDDGALR